jgi:ATP-dependent Lon protease
MQDQDNNQELFSKLSLTNLSQARKDELLLQLDELVEARVALAVSEKMSHEANEKLDDLVDNGTPEQLLDFVKLQIPDYDAMVAKIAEDTINELANNKDAVLAEVERLRSEETSDQDTAA